MKAEKEKVRCAWVGEDMLSIHYHDSEWGVPIYDDQRLFEFLILEGAQAGLNWITVLKKREHYRVCFANFAADKMARFNQRKVKALLADPGIIRNRLKVAAAISNAKAYLQLQQQGLHFSDYIWSFVNGKPIQNCWQHIKQMPTTTAISDAMAKDLKKRGFKFVGSTICHAFMQAVGMVNDHTTDCFRYRELKVRPQ